MTDSRSYPEQAALRQLRAALQEIEEIGRTITDLKNEAGIRMGNIAHAALLGARTFAVAQAKPDYGAEAQFLLDRLDEFDPGEEDAEREYHGHVAPAIARLRSALSSTDREAGR